MGKEANINTIINKLMIILGIIEMINKYSKASSNFEILDGKETISEKYQCGVDALDIIYIYSTPELDEKYTEIKTFFASLKDILNIKELAVWHSRLGIISTHCDSINRLIRLEILPKLQ